MNGLKRTAIAYAGLAALAFVFDRVYALFAHGVFSWWMSAAPLVLLGLGTGLYAALGMAAPGVYGACGYRVFTNAYGSGMAILVTGMLIQGVLAIAGGTSAIARGYVPVGIGVLAGSLVLLAGLISGAKGEGDARGAGG